MIESFRAGALERMGLGYEAVRGLNPDIIYCSISGYGRTGPLADKPGYDLLIQGYSGLMSLTGEPEGLPLRVRFSLVDLFTGMMAYGAIVTARRIQSDIRKLTKPCMITCPANVPTVELERPEASNETAKTVAANRPSNGSRV